MIYLFSFAPIVLLVLFFTLTPYFLDNDTEKLLYADDDYDEDLAGTQDNRSSAASMTGHSRTVDSFEDTSEFVDPSLMYTDAYDKEKAAEAEDLLSKIYESNK